MRESLSFFIVLLAIVLIYIAKVLLVKVLFYMMLEKVNKFVTFK